MPRPYAPLVLTLSLLAVPACRSKTMPPVPPPSSSFTTGQSSFGTVDGRDVTLFTMKNANGMEVHITDYGCTVVRLLVPDRDGNLEDVVLGFDNVDDYVEKSPYFGAMVGRVANRIANGTFTLDGEEHSVATNAGSHHLHGGVKGFDKVVWNAEPAGQSITFAYRSPDGEESYPGNLDVTVVVSLTQDNTLSFATSATCDAATPVNIAHHSYWNLGGHDSGTILGHELVLDCRTYTPGDETLIPTGAIEPVEGTPFDFSTAKTMGRDIDQLPPSGDDPGGYDVNYVVDGEPTSFRRVARAIHPESGRRMEVFADQVGVQFYTGNFLDGIAGKDGAGYDKHDGFCLETQAFPDAINKIGTTGWPDVVLRPGETYEHVMEHRFFAD